MPTLAIPQVSFKKSDFDDPSLTLFNQAWQNVVQSLNVLLGAGGTTTLTSHLSLSGNKIQNIANPTAPQDAVSLAYADANYGPAQIRQQLDILGKSVMQSVRRLNDVNQRESTSSFLNDLVSTAPTANTSVVTFSPPSGGTITLSITGGTHQKVDGSTVAYPSLIDTVPQPGGGASAVYYYCIQKNSTQLFREGTYTQDTPTNRVLVSIDGQTIIAVVRVVNSGGDTLNSAAGGSPPQTGSNVHILFRL
jgi:hypothetical protein